MDIVVYLIVVLLVFEAGLRYFDRKAHLTLQKQLLDRIMSDSYNTYKVHEHQENKTEKVISLADLMEQEDQDALSVL